MSDKIRNGEHAAGIASRPASFLDDVGKVDLSRASV